jgi:hypothetical protein
MTEPPLTPIHVAIPRIIGDLPAIGKDSEMTQGQQYRYRGIDDIMPHVKTLFARHGVHVAPIYELVTDTEILVGRNNSKMTRVVLKGMFRFTANDGSSIVCQTFGEARDSGDKAFNKAMTAALKYAITQVLAIADGDDPDHYRPELADGEQREVSTPNYDRLVELGPAMKAAGVADDVKAWARTARIDLRRGHDDELLADVIAYAEDLLAQPVDTGTVANHGPDGNELRRVAGPPPVPEPIERDVVAEAKAALDAKLAEVEGEPAVPAEGADPLERIMEAFGPGTEEVES